MEWSGVEWSVCLAGVQKMALGGIRYGRRRQGARARSGWRWRIDEGEMLVRSFRVHLSHSCNPLGAGKGDIEWTRRGRGCWSSQYS